MTIPTKSNDKTKPDLNIVLGLIVTDKYEGARVVNGKVKRAIYSDTLKGAINNGFGPVTRTEYPQGTSITVTLQIEYPKPEDEGNEEDEVEDKKVSNE